MFLGRVRSQVPDREALEVHRDSIPEPEAGNENTGTQAAARAPGRRRAYQARQVAFKVLALVKRGREVTVTVPVSERSHVALFYDPSKWSEYPTVAIGERMVTFTACEREGEGSSSWNWATQFNGGIIVPRPHCVVLDVRVGERDPVRRIEAAFGRGVCSRPT